MAKKKLAFFFILVVLAGGGFAVYKSGIINFRKFPEAGGAKQITLKCNYKGKDIVIKEKLYESIDDFYGSDPKKQIYTFTGNYKGFVSSYPEDKTLSNIIQKIKDKGAKLELSKDETADLATCFVQNIPYDKEKAKLVLSGKSLSPGSGKDTWGRFPYETLYDNKGICTDKSYLESAILKELGYGVALLTFDSERHMAVGVKTPEKYSSYGGKYSYLETTNTGYVVGVVPAIDRNIGGAKKAEIEKARGGKNNFWIPDIPEPDIKPSEITEIADGQEYARIAETTKRTKRIKDLVRLINSKSKELFAFQTKLKNENKQIDPTISRYEDYANDLRRAEDIYNQNPTPENRTYYKSVYSQYEDLYSKAKTAINSYNNKLSIYNAMVSDFNALVGEYNSLNKNIW